jgi:hypothetical protein
LAVRRSNHSARYHPLICDPGWLRTGRAKINADPHKEKKAAAVTILDLELSILYKIFEFRFVTHAVPSICDKNFSEQIKNEQERVKYRLGKYSS